MDQEVDYKKLDEFTSELFEESVKLKKQLVVVFEENQQFEKSANELIDGLLNNSSHPELKSFYEKIIKRHQFNQACMTIFTNFTYDTSKKLQPDVLLEKSLNIQKHVVPSSFSNSDAKTLLFDSIALGNTTLLLYRFYTAVVVLQFSSAINAQNSVYRDLFKTNETNQRPDAKQQAKASSKRLSEAFSSDLLSLFIPGLGTLRELINIAKETRDPKLVFSPNTANEQDRIHHFYDNLLHTMNHHIGALERIKEANDVFDICNSEFAKKSEKTLEVLED